MADLKTVIQRIKDRADIVDHVGRVVVLKKQGNRLWGCCPFHQEKTPSFTVRPQTGTFHCFGCGVGGTVIDFVMQSERLPLMDAVEKLAKEYAIEMPERRFAAPTPTDAEEALRRDIEAANRAALEFYRQALAERRNPLANNYLPERGLTPEIIEQFQIGAALDDWNALTDHLLRNGYTEDLLVEGGLSVRSEKGSLYDRFRHRLIFPILDQHGRVAGFGGRALVKDDRTPKYLNSAETAVYKKSRLLYALNIAQEPIGKLGHAILCEGYMDVITMHAFGFPQTVASLGTAFTPEQARLLKRHTSRVYFLYDGDAAGQKAMLRGGEALLGAGLDTRVIELPAEDDPDTFLRRDGAEALRARIASAREFIDFAIAAHLRDVEQDTLSGQAELVERIAPFLRAMKSDLMREGSLTRLLKHTPAIPREAVLRLVDRAPRTWEGEREGSSAPGESSPAAVPAFDSLERALLKVMVESEGALEVVRAQLRHEWVGDVRLEPWVFGLLDAVEPVRAILSQLESSQEWPGERDIIYEILAWDCPVSRDPVRDAEEVMLRLHERHRLRITQELIERIEQTMDEESRNRLMAAYHEEHLQRHAHTKGRLRVQRRR